MIRTVTMTLTAVALSILSLGCGRMFSEGMGVATGASGKVVEIGMTPDLTKYKGLRIEAITVAQGLQAPSEMPAMIGSDLAATAQKRGLTPEGQPGLKLSGQIVHYESSSTVDTAIGPLAESILREADRRKWQRCCGGQSGRALQGNVVERCEERVRRRRQGIRQVVEGQRAQDAR